LYRPEAIAYASDRLSGDVVVAVPLAWRSVGWLIFSAVVAGLIFLSLASYSRVETVAGVIMPAAGVSSVIAPRSGVIAGLPVREGQQVSAGTILASIRAEEDSADGESVAGRIEAAIQRQDAGLIAQSDAVQLSAQAEFGQLHAQQAGLVAEIEQIRAQIALQQILVASAQKDLERARVVAVNGFISKHDLQIREDTLVSRQQDLVQLAQSLAAKRAVLAEAERSVARVAAQSRMQSANLAALRAETAREAASASGARAYVLRAPVAGRVTALVARVGQPANPQTPLMTIVPNGSVLRAELAIPSAAIGFVRQGQEVRIAVDAFPYQRFGTIKGKILTVPAGAVSQQEPDGKMAPVYPVTVALDQMKISAFGRQESLVSGMALTARIVTERQSLAEWLFEPLFAVRRR